MMIDPRQQQHRDSTLVYDPETGGMKVVHPGGKDRNKPEVENTSGITPVEFNVLIRQDKSEEKTPGGVILVDSTKEREKHTATRGEIVALSPMAFNADVWPENLPTPVPGQRVAFVQHSGSFIKGTDNEEYRLVKDKDILALIGDADAD